ncbi:MAG TPA: response regulator transcription factor [Acidothermaceae bacterium]|nr:response regulator transcription factor [Acidothermaceae bacterium]
MPSLAAVPTVAGAIGQARLLVVDDEPNILELLSATLRFSGFEVASASTGHEALETTQTFKPDLIVLDVMMPGIDGFDVARRLRAGGVRTPVLFLTARDSDEDSYEVLKASQPVELSATEFKLLRYFLRNPGRVLSKTQILEHVWSYDFGGDANIVETYVSHLRRKIDTTQPRLLHTLRGMGYALRVPRA